MPNTDAPDEMLQKLSHSICQSTRGMRWLSGRVLESRPMGCRFEPHRRHCLVSFSKTLDLLLSTVLV